MFWVISVYLNIRNTLPKSGRFLLGHPVYIYIYIYIYIYSYLNFFCSMASQTPVGQGLPIIEASRSHTTTHTVGRRRRDLYLTMQNIHNRQNIHAPGGIRTRNPSTRAAADPRLRPRARWDKQWQIHDDKIRSLMKPQFVVTHRYTVLQETKTLANPQ